MGMDKKATCPASSSEEKARRYSADKACITNNRRRDLYKELSSDKREALLLQRRTRYRELSNQNLLSSSLTPLPNAQLRLTGQRGLTITEISPHPETGGSFRIDTSTVVPAKGKDIIGCLSIFEAQRRLHPLNNITQRQQLLLAEVQRHLSINGMIQKAMTEKDKGGSGKTYLYRALLATVRSKGFIALATTTSGVAASILPGGRTAHSGFKIPINTDEQFSCNISSPPFDQWKSP